MRKRIQMRGAIVAILTFATVVPSLCAQNFTALYAANNVPVVSHDDQAYTLLDLLNELEDQFHVVFDYDKKSLRGKGTSITREQLNTLGLGEMLNKVLPPLGLQYKKYNEHSYIIYPVKPVDDSMEENKPEPGTDIAPGSVTGAHVIEEEFISSGVTETTVSGTVTDETGTAMPGVNVIVKGTTQGTTTDIDGRYSLTVPTGDAILVFSFIGYLMEEVPIGNRSVIDLALTPDVSTLDEIVVIGYGTVKKRDLTGAVYSVKSEEIVQTPTHNAIEAIQGRIPGMDITRSSGVPGAGTNVVIRGNKSITSRDNLVERNAPLYIVDGFQLPQGSSIDDLNPNDIASIDVLKDASATAIYGAMGANGVVIVTTKKGTAGKTKVSYNGYFGVNYYSFPESRIGEDYIQLRREAWRASVTPTTPNGEWNSPADDPSIFPGAGEWDAIQAGQWVDWVDLVKQNGTQQSHTVSLASGTEKTKVFTSAGYFKEEGMLRDNDFTRYNLRFNLDQTVSKWAKACISSQLTYSIQNNRMDPLSQATSISPLGVPYNEFGEVNTYPIEFDQSRISPLADEKDAHTARDNNIRTNILANAYLELNPVKGLTFRSNLGTSLSFNRRGIYYDKESLARANTKTSYASSETGFNRFFNWDNIVTYTKEIADHSVTVTGITSYIQSDRDNTEAAGSNQIAASQLYYGLDGTIPATIGSPYEGWNNMAYAGRINYSYKGKYLLTMSGRYDGASRLAPGNKWAFFPSVGLGWNISDEAFLQDLEEITLLKLRGSYGISGNYAMEVYGTQSGLVAGRNMSFGEVPAPMYQFKPLIGNPTLGWEKSTTTNIGLDVSALRDRISASIDWYKTITSDILMERPLPQSTGVSSVYQNIAETENKGIEISVTSQNIKTNDFQWNTTVTFSRNKEAITALIDGKDIIVNERESLLLGKPINSFYTFKKLGIWQTSEADEAALYHANSATGNTFQPGDLKVADLNGDFIIQADSDRMYIGSTVPKWVAGFQNTFSYKGIDLGVFVFVRWGQMIDAKFLGRYNPSGTGNGPAIIDYWTPENPTNDFPRPRKGESLSTYTGYTGYQALNFVDGSFLKIRNITLGYTLPSALSERIALSRVRFYVTGNNLFIKTKSHLIQDYDPERDGSESSPLSRSFVVGMNIDF